MPRWTWKRVVEVAERLNAIYDRFPQWEKLVASEVLADFRCGYCTFKGKVNIVPNAYLKWIPVYYFCANCGNIRLKTVKDVGEDGKFGYVWASMGVKHVPKFFWELPIGFTPHVPVESKYDANPIWLSRDYVIFALRTEKRGRQRKFNPRVADREIYEVLRLSQVSSKYGFDATLIHEKVNRQFKRGYSRSYVLNRLFDMEVRGFFWRTIRYGKSFWVYIVLDMAEGQRHFREIGMAKPDERGVLYKTEFDESILEERDNYLKSKRQKFIRWFEIEKRNKALIESLNF